MLRRCPAHRYLALMPKGRVVVPPETVTPAQGTALFRATEAAAMAAEKERPGYFNVPDCDYGLHAGVPPVLSAAQARVIREVQQRHICDRLNELALGTQYESHLLPVVIRQTAYDAMHAGLHSAASEHFNHAFFWRAVRPWGTACGGRFKEVLDATFSPVGESLGVAPVIASMKEAAMARTEPGWVWLVWRDSRLAITTTDEGATPLARDEVPLATVPTLHHFRHVDYGTSAKGKEAFVDNCLKAIDWHSADRTQARTLSS